MHAVTKAQSELRTLTTKPGERRPTLEGLHFEHGQAIATNGRMLGIIGDGEPTESKDGGWTLTHESTKQLASMLPGKRPSAVHIRANGSTALHAENATMTASLLIVEEEYPDVSQIRPKGDTYTDIDVSALYLERICAIVRKGGFGNGIVRLRVRDAGSPIEITTTKPTDDGEQGYFLLMPCTLKS